MIGEDSTADENYADADTVITHSTASVQQISWRMTGAGGFLP
jgi:hypothetical protein